MKQIITFLKEEIVLTAATVLALLSMFVIRPDLEYLTYVDVRTLVLLFCLMLAMAGFQEQGIFRALAQSLLAKAKNDRQLCLILVFLCFFSAMLITNDVALITFVPFTITILNMAGAREQILIVVVLQTIAANLGSMLTPIGNPQNLYLYAASGMSAGAFLKLMFPAALLSGLLLFVCCMFKKRTQLRLDILQVGSEQAERNRKRLVFYTLVFVLSLLTVFHVVPYPVPFVFALVGAAVIYPQILKKVDYALLLTFISFFVFIGNMGRIPAVNAWLSEILTGREMLISFLCSQMISNVPAAVLLSGFTTRWDQLLLGVNIGGLGTMIASMASLISYKLYVREVPEQKGRYFRTFTIMNVLFAVILLLAM